MVANPSGQMHCSKDNTRGRAAAGGYFWAGTGDPVELRAKSSQTLIGLALPRTEL
jgi:hypothetical protein